MANAETLAPLFAQPVVAPSPWLEAVFAVLALVAVAILVVGLVRGRLMPASIVAGLIFLPAAIFAFGNVVLMERSERIEFCGSCHTMTPIIESVRNDGFQGDSAPLSSRHVALGAIPVANACFDCHSGYGPTGGLEAHMVGLVHIWKQATGTYTYPLKLSGRYDVNACLGCHAQSEPFRSQSAHADPDVQKALLDGSLTCWGTCHPPAHPAAALAGPKETR